MPTIVVMPSLGESVLEGTVDKWLVELGARVERGQELVLLATDKTSVGVPAPSAGVVTKFLVKLGETIPVGAQLCEIDESATAAAGASKPAAPVATEMKAIAAKPAAAAAAPATPTTAAHAEAIQASPATRKLAREMGIDTAHLPANAVVGRGDLLRANTQPAAGAMELPSSLPAFIREVGGGAFKVPPYVEQAGDKVVPFSRRRKIIADHMVYSKLSSPHVVTFAECDLHKTSILRDKHKDQLKKEGVSLTYLAFVAAATAKALREFPQVNARVLEDAYVEFHDVNLGIAVETAEGLVVPVVKHADELRVRGLARAIDDVAIKARDGRLVPDDLSNKTFTISNPGRRGNLVGGAIISQPNVGILRIGEIKKRVVVVEADGQDVMAIHPVMYMALSYDHRIVDGVAANGFLFRINELLEKSEFDV